MRPCLSHCFGEDAARYLACFSHVGDFGIAFKDAEVVDNGL